MPKAIGPKFPIVVTSYEMALAEARRMLKQYEWKYVVVDEVSDLIVQARFPVKVHVEKQYFAPAILTLFSIYLFF